MPTMSCTSSGHVCADDLGPNVEKVDIRNFVFRRIWDIQGSIAAKYFKAANLNPLATPASVLGQEVVRSCGTHCKSALRQSLQVGSCVEL